MYVMCVTFVQCLEPQGSRFTNFHYYCLQPTSLELQPHKLQKQQSFTHLPFFTPAGSVPADDAGGVPDGADAGAGAQVTRSAAGGDCNHCVQHG